MKGNEMMIITIACWKCDKEMRMALIGDNGGNLECGPEGFSKQQQKFAEEHGVILRVVESKTAEESYLASVCGSCGAFIGEWFFFARYYTPALYGGYKYERV